MWLFGLMLLFGLIYCWFWVFLSLGIIWLSWKFWVGLLFLGWLNVCPLQSLFLLMRIFLLELDLNWSLCLIVINSFFGFIWIQLCWTFYVVQLDHLIHKNHLLLTYGYIGLNTIDCTFWLLLQLLISYFPRQKAIEIVVDSNINWLFGWFFMVIFIFDALSY